MGAEDEVARVVEYLRAHPGTSRAEAMRALQVSARLVARAEARLDDQAFARGRQRRRYLGLGFALAAGGALAWSWSLVGERSPAGLPVRSQESVAAERSLYAALDQRSSAHVTEATKHLGSDDEALRMAALRYLTGVGAKETRLVAMLDDPSERVRRAAIQLLGAASVELPGLTERAFVLVLDERREVAERLLGLDLLERRIPRWTSTDLERVLPLVADAQAGLRERAEALLAQAVGRSPPASEVAPEERLRAWSALLSESP